MLFRLSWPVVAGMLLQSLLSTVDVYFVAKLGAPEAAAATLGNSAASVIFCISFLITGGTVALVARSHGEGNLASVRQFCGGSIMLSTIIGLVVSAFCVVATTGIIRIMFNPDEQITELSRQFLSVLLGGTVFIFLNSTLRTAIQALGDTRTPLYVFGAANVLNALLNPILIFQAGLGVAGSAWATVISSALSFAVILWMLVRKVYGRSFTALFISMKINLIASARILRIGGWACVQQVARPITGMFMFRLVFEVGAAEGTAAFGIGMQLLSYCFIFMAGLSTAVAILIGNNLGSGNIRACETVIRDGIKLAWLNMLVFALPFLVFPEAFMRFFIDNAAIVEGGAMYLRLVYLGLYFSVYITIYSGVFQGAGDTYPLMLSALVSNVGLKVPLAYFLAKSLSLGLTGVWVAIALSLAAEAAIVTWYYRTNRWKERMI